MSMFVEIHESIFEDGRLLPNDRLTLSHLMHQRQPDGLAAVTADELASQMGVDVRRVSCSLARLRRLGWIVEQEYFAYYSAPRRTHYLVKTIPPVRAGGKPEPTCIEGEAMAS
jgi:predicted transcriptional regulator